MKLRVFTTQDAKRVALLLNDQAVSKSTANIPFPYSEADALDWINRTSNNSNRKPYAVELNNEIVACVSYWPYEHNTLEVGYWVGKSYWGQGVCTRALDMLLSSPMFPKKVEVVAKVMSDNIASEKVLLGCGFLFKENCMLKKGSEEIDGKFFIKRAVS